ncbi:MAG: hypothetical protein K2H46_02605 [Muribaculaceae bacterium]|nr:hypothetical protein [Muribaculaceae bacterium]
MAAVNYYAAQLGTITGITPPEIKPHKFPSGPTAAQMREAADRFRKALDTIPDEWLVAVSTPLYAFCSLIWDWADSIINVCCIEQRDFKKECRRIRSLHSSYDKFRACVVTGELSVREQMIGESMEDTCNEAIRRFSTSVMLRLSEHGFAESDRMFYLSVLQVLAALDAVDRYSDRLDSEIVNRWKAPNPVLRRSFVQDEVMRLRPILKKMIPDKAIEVARHSISLAALEFNRCFIEVEEYVFEKEIKEKAKRLKRKDEQRY